MFTSIDDFVAEWSQEAQMTKQVMNLLTDESLNQVITDKHRTLGKLAWHLVESVGYMTSLGLKFEGPDSGEKVRYSAAAIAEQYERISEAILEAVKTQWDSESLRVTQTVFGEEWNNGASLRFTIMHQAHHRGQMTVLMRQAGLRIPDLYGPNYDSWIERGMEPLV
ncbi:DinB family protein [Brevibacillus porteri]|uniref:DinB family protein n=1 Tax=Brevibacillus porteri TaxID=2126350 RepID=UPI00370C5DEB